MERIIMLPQLNDVQSKLLNKSVTTDWSVPEYKLKHFVAGSHIHPFHKVRQYLMELNTRHENLETFQRDIEKIEIEIELEQELSGLTTLVSQKKLHELEVKYKTRDLAVLAEKFKTQLADRNKIFKLIEEFNLSIEGKDDQGRLWIDLLDDPIESERIEKEYWEYRLAKQSALDMIAYGRIGVGNMEAIMQLDPESQNKCIAMAYETLISNEDRMNLISAGVVERLGSGKTVTDITQLLGIHKTDFMTQLENNKENNNVPSIQKC